MTLLFCDCFSGISGDMFLGALLDAGLPVEFLSQEYGKINLPEFKGVSAIKVNKGALAATQVVFDLHEQQPDSQHSHSHHGGHRHLSDIHQLVMASGLSKAVKHTTLLIFQKLAEAEAKVHGSTVEEVHFHEVGATDSILDIVGAAIGINYFGIQKVYSSPLPIGTGQVHTQHGLLPLPAPATAELISMAKMPIRFSPVTVELVTPTGAAILAALAEFSQPNMVMQRVGTGAGQRELEWPNVLRVFIGSPTGNTEEYIELDTNIDDMNPQIFGLVMAKLFEAGALDVYFTPIFMKKNRPATKLSVVARKQDETVLSTIILQETSTLGIRVTALHRNEADREIRMVDTRYGNLPVKLKKMNGKIVQATPEFDACAELAKQNGLPVSIVLQEAAFVCHGFFGPEVASEE